MSYARVAGELVLNEKSDDLSRASTCLRYGFGNILRALAHAGEEDTRCRRFYRSELRVSLCEEVVCVHGSCELCCERTRALVGFDSSGKDNKVSLYMELFVHDEVGRLNIESAVSLRRYLTDRALDIVNAVVLDSSAVEFIEVLAGSTHVDIEYINVGIGVLFAGEHCVLCGVHTAYLGAVLLAALGCAS